MNKLDKITNKYGFTKDEKEDFYTIIKPIYESDFFQKRLTSEFPHHGSITLGLHILEVATITYKYSKKIGCNKKIATIIAMMHDLYTFPWQNSKIHKSLFNKHGFTHPLEAVINAINNYPEYFIDQNESKIIIDGIIHHMYPFPVRVFEDNKTNTLKLNNYYLFKNIKGNYKKYIIESSNRHKIGKISICKSKYIEGNIVRKCDKKVSFNQIENISSLTSLITGKNKKIINKEV